VQAEAPALAAPAPADGASAAEGADAVSDDDPMKAMQESMAKEKK
jgi:hypothetical protein